MQLQFAFGVSPDMIGSVAVYAAAAFGALCIYWVLNAVYGKCKCGADCSCCKEK